MSMWGRALAGAGSGASEIANKYIDQEIMLARAQAMADIQRVSSVRTEQELGPVRSANAVAAETAMGPVRTANEVSRFKATDAAERDPARLAELRAAKDADVRAGHTTTTDLALEDARNVPLTEAQIARTNTVAKGTMGAAAEASGLQHRAAEAAKAEFKTFETEPGKIVFDAKGNRIAENTNPTAGQLQADLYREGLKGQRGEDKERYYVASAQQLRGRIDEKDKAIDRMRAENPQASTPGKPLEKGLIWDSKAVPNPAYDTMQAMLRERAELVTQQKRLEEEWKSHKADPGGSSSSSSSGRADPGGFRSSGSKFGNLPGETDKAKIYADEYIKETAKAAAATDPEDRARIESNLAALAGEMRKIGVPIPSVSGSKPVAPLAQTAANAPSAAPQMPPAPPAPVKGNATPAIPPKGPTTDEMIRAAQAPAGSASFRENALAKRAQAAADPELVQLEAQRAQILRAGGPGAAVKANDLVARFTQLRKERYGF